MAAATSGVIIMFRLFRCFQISFRTRLPCPLPSFSLLAFFFWTLSFRFRSALFFSGGFV